jgi:flagellar secretion chaperone FliS
MTAAYARSQYEEMQVQTTPGRLVVMLYDGALRFLHHGLEAMRQKNLEQQGLYLGKTQSILGELLNTLDMSAGELAIGLRSIYYYCIERLVTANAEDRTEYVEEVIRLLSSLREAWEHAERTIRSEEAAAVSEATPLLAGAAR